VLWNLLDADGVYLWMTSGMSGFVGPIVICVSLSICHSTLVTEYSDLKGVPVFLPHRCIPNGATDQGAEGASVRYRIDHSGFVNADFAPVEDDLRREVRQRVGWRNERVVFFSADEGLGYREVATVLSDLRKDDPELNIFLMTRSEVSAIDGMRMWPMDLCVG
jgi:biopolymer transport protein ExbD